METKKLLTVKLNDDGELDENIESSSDEESSYLTDDESESNSDDEGSVDSLGELNLHQSSEDEDDEENNVSDEENEKDVLNSVLPTDEQEPANKDPSIQEISHSLGPKTKSRTVAVVDEYEHDSSDEEDLRNTIGNIPVEWYNQYDHIGYDQIGKKIIKPKDSDENEIEHFLSKLEDPNYWRTVKDKFTGEKVVLTDKDADVVKRMKKGLYPDSNYNPYPEYVDFFTYEKMIHPVTNRPETKASFISSISEKRAISKLVTRIKREWQNPKIQPKPKEAKYDFNYDIWENETNEESKRQAQRRSKHIPAPKARLPGHQESFNPPPEYLPPDYDESKKIRQVPSGFIPHKFPNLRTVPFYNNFVRERFDRCLDLYLCPRARKMKSQVNPEDLIPNLPRPKDLQPFPTVESIVYKGHDDTVNSISFEPRGEFFVSGCEDNCVIIWETLTGRCFKKFTFESPVKAVSWNPNPSLPMIAVATGKNVVILNPNVCDKSASSSLDQLFNNLGSIESSNTPVSSWKFYNENDEEWNSGHRISIEHKFDVEKLDWHSRGDYLSILMPSGAHKSVVIHQISKKRSQLPFSKSHGQIVCSLFHPTRPYFFVASKQFIRIYDLANQQQTKKLSTNCKLVSNMAIHPKGDNLIVSSFDCRLPWFDLDASNKPYKIMRYHKKSIRTVAFSPAYPLFVSGSDDGSLIVSYGMVYDDLTSNPLIVPLKILHAHEVVDSVGVTDSKFHPTQPWVISSGADKKIRLFT